MTRDRIIGIGSPHGDDSIGWQIIDRLRGRDDMAGQLIATRPVDLIDHLNDCDRLILVDAGRWEASPGAVLRLVWPDQRIADCQRGSTHGIGVAETLRLAESLGRLPARVVVFSIAISATSPLSPPHETVSRALPRLEQLLVKELEGDL